MDIGAWVSENMFYEVIAKIVPARILNAFKENLEYAEIDVNAQKLLGFVILYALALSAAIGLNAKIFFQINPLPIASLSFVIIVAGSYYWLSTIAESRGNFVERILPDALQLIASNIKAGFTTERALFMSAREEFGAFSEELKLAGKKIAAGRKTGEALKEMGKRIKSKSLERAMNLIVLGIKSGAQMSSLLLELGNDLREENSLKKEIAANINIYVLMIFVTAAIGAPLLLGISSSIVGIIGEQTAKVPAEELAGMTVQGPIPVIGLTAVTEGISEEFVELFAMIVLVVTSIFASLTLGIIKTGREKNGIKFIPIMLAISFTLFFAVKIVLEQAMQGIITFL